MSRKTLFFNEATAALDSAADSTETKAYIKHGCLFTDNETISFDSLDELMFIISQKVTRNTKIFVENLSFFGYYIVDFFTFDANLLLCFDTETKVFFEDSELPDRSFTYLFTKNGFQNITVNCFGHIVKFINADPLIGSPRKSADDMSCEDRAQQMFNVLSKLRSSGYKKNTIASNSMDELRAMIGRNLFNELYPHLEDRKLDEKDFGSKNAFDYIFNAYGSGWLFLNPNFKQKTLKNQKIDVFDCNGMYPAQLSCKFQKIPVGEPKFVKCEHLPEYLKGESAKSYYYFIRFKCSFFLRPRRFPFVKIKGDHRFRAGENLVSTCLNANAEYYKRFSDIKFEKKYQKKLIVTMTMSEKEFKLFRENYLISDFEILDFCVFEAAKRNFFYNFFEKRSFLRGELTGDLKKIEKSMANTVIGKFATGYDAPFFVLQKTEKRLSYPEKYDAEKAAGYIPLAAAVVSAAKCEVVRIAQQNYDSFIYSNTDSFHLLNCDNPEGFLIDQIKSGYFKLEFTASEGRYLRENSYVLKNGDDLKIVCSMSENAKDNIIQAFLKNENFEKKSKQEIEFIKRGLEVEDYQIGLRVPGNEILKLVPGGVLRTKVESELN